MKQRMGMDGTKEIWQTIPNPCLENHAENEIIIIMDDRPHDRIVETKRMIGWKKMLSSDNQCTNLKEMHWYMIFLSYLNTRSEISPAMSDYLITWHLPRLAGIKAGLSAAEVARL